MTEATIKPIDGNYLVWRVLAGGRLRQKVGMKHTPRYRHRTFDAAETEAKRLAGLMPDSTFVVLQEIATVKIREPEERGEAEYAQ